MPSFHTANMVHNSKPATCSFSLSSIRARPPSREVVLVGEDLDCAPNSCTRVRGHYSSEWIHTEVSTTVSVRLRSEALAVTLEVTVRTLVRMLTLAYSSRL
jgi:hypothetical protein